MDIDLTEDQRLLQDSTRRFVEDRSPIGVLRKLADSKQGLAMEAWRNGAEQGWVALFVPEAFGGFAESAKGLVDGAIVAEELGRVVYPGPFLSSAVTAFAIAESGSDHQKAAYLPALAAGESVVAWAVASLGVQAGLTPGGVRVVRDGDGFRLFGAARFVEDAEIASTLLVSAVSDGGVSQFLLPADVAGVSIRPLDALDLGRRLATVEFADVVVGADALLGVFEGAADAVERQIQTAVVLQCAETVGVVDRALEICLDYTKQRLVFGRPVASYQAIKHRLADHVTQLEGMKAAVAHAAKAVQANAADAGIAISIAKSQCGRWGTEIVRDCMHLHGGIGVTWEHDMHFYLRRAVSNEALLGTPGAHHERLCRLAGL